MMWKSECSRYEHQLALWVGGDLDVRSQGECRRHLDLCPACSQRYQQLKTAAGALTDAASRSRLRPADESLWPALRRQLHAPRTQLAEPARTPAWLSLSAVAAACVALVVLAMEQPVRMADERNADFQLQHVSAPVWNPPVELNRKPNPPPFDSRLPSSKERSSGY
jgi:anti-sigma factor RsiW